MTMPKDLPLRDVQLPPPPGWWPPAPGWWLLFVLGVGLLYVLWRWLRRCRQRRAWARLFDQEFAASTANAQALTVLSGLLRRAARRVDPRADSLRGEEWLRLLDGRNGNAFSHGPGRVLLDGSFQRDPNVADLDALSRLVRQRFLELMAGRR